jgi:hypothetical protein
MAGLDFFEADCFAAITRPILIDLRTALRAQNALRALPLGRSLPASVPRQLQAVSC